MIPHVKSFSAVYEAEIDLFLELSCFFYDPMDVGNLISGSFALSQSIFQYFLQCIYLPTVCISEKTTTTTKQNLISFSFVL